MENKNEPATIKSNFPLGQVVCTPGVRDSISFIEQMIALSRHARGDWGDVCLDDWAENELSLKEGFRLFSVYRTQKDMKFWIITEADRSVTTLLLPDEY